MGSFLQNQYVQRAKLAAGLVLFVFVATHLMNHAAGLFGPQALEIGQSWRMGFTRSALGAGILIAAATIHVLYALARISERATMRLRRWEVTQIALGFAIPILLIPHVVGTRVAHELFGVIDTYDYVLARLVLGGFWLTQTALLLVVWVHGCIGIHYWLRLNPWYQQIAPVLFGLAVSLPTAALAGFAASARDLSPRIVDEMILIELQIQTNWPDPVAEEQLFAYASTARMVFGLAVIAAILIFFGRGVLDRMGRRLKITYTDGPTVSAPIGPTLLEISRMNNVQHTSLCGGRARCTTCRVRVVDGLETLTSPGQLEADSLKSIKAPGDVRLACQLRPTRPLTVQRLVAPKEERPRPGGPTRRSGEERIMVVLFMDTRGFTRLSKGRLPYDVVFVLNELFGAIVPAVEQAGGVVEKYLGDGLMAYFGRDSTPEAACRAALAAARGMDLALDQVNQRLRSDLGEDLKIGIGIHVGGLVLGEIGHGDTASDTIVGETVNTASRLEALTKEYGGQLVISEEVAKRAGLPLDQMERHIAPIRGLPEPIGVYVLRKSREAPMLEAAE